MPNFVLQEKCDKNVKNMGDKIDKLSDIINNLRVEIAMLPEKILEKTDKRYASQSDFIFWRKILVFGIILTIFGLVLSTFLK